MICRICGARAEYRDCSAEEHYYSLCDFCIAKLKEKGELDLWDRKYHFAIKEIDGDYHELYEDRELIARVHKDDIKSLSNRLNEIYDDKQNKDMKLYEIDTELKRLHSLIKEED